jgi:hypothetical protein
VTKATDFPSEAQYVYGWTLFHTARPGKVLKKSGADPRT